MPGRTAGTASLGAHGALPLKNGNPAGGLDAPYNTRINMADKQIVFSDQEQQQIQAIVIDKDKGEALKFLAKLVQEIKGTAGHACSPGPIR
jgi:hypothetical protein